VKAYLAVVGGIVTHLVIGNLYLWGNISEYVVSYFHHLGDSEASNTHAVIVLPLSFTL
jgi:hypothetical protein